MGADTADLRLLVVPQQDVDVALLGLHDGDGGHLQTHAVRLTINVEILLKIQSLAFLSARLSRYLGHENSVGLLNVEEHDEDCLADVSTSNFLSGQSYYYTFKTKLLHSHFMNIEYDA